MTAIDPAHIRAVRHYQTGLGHQWVTALAATRIVGRRIPGQTSALASDLCRSVDTVERMARAGHLYRQLRYSIGRVGNTGIGTGNRNVRRDRLAELRDCRRQLSLSHWDAVAKAQAAQEFGPLKALMWLLNALHGRWSVEQLREHLSRKEQHHPDFPDILGNYYDRLMREAERWGGAEGEVLAALAAQFDEARARLVEVAP